ncbi:MAG TPA: hypothetical protein ENJ32_07325 [Crenotrichaceae bacterium]|nr:hypothetical protein [Crenotrichaceae bacterium]
MKIRIFIFVTTATLLAGMVTSALAGSISIPGLGSSVSAPVASFTEAKFDGVIQQQFDYSCGSAALSTLLSYHYEDSSDEETVFREMYDTGDKKKIEALGFSLLDMKKYLEKRGYNADGFKLSMEKYIQYNVPAIVLLNTNGYKHFVVVKGIDKDKILLGDPALGLRVVSRGQFLNEYGGIFFLVRNHATLGRYHFNQAEEWGVFDMSPQVKDVTPTGLSEFTLSLPRPREF